LVATNSKFLFYNPILMITRRCLQNKQSSMS
jgi:hypothetical protein